MNPIILLHGMEDLPSESGENVLYPVFSGYPESCPLDQRPSVEC